MYFVYHISSFSVYSILMQYLKDPDITIPFAFLLGKIIPEKVWHI